MVWHILLQSTRIKEGANVSCCPGSSPLCPLLYLLREKGIGVSIAAIGTFLYYRFRLIGKFGGLSGDLAGWFVQMCELFMLAAVVLTEYL
ncbi:MAG: adenosylcobinamide-GDP ribazoletransferase [Gallintestinimicrobium sp.]